MSDTKKRTRRIILGALIGLAAVATVLPALTGLVSALGLSNEKKNAEPVPTTTKAQVLTIKPLPVRPVISAFVTTPEQCPPDTPAPPDQPMRICDINKTAVYELGPEGTRVQLVNADTFRNPLTGVQVVQMTLTKESAQQFGPYTAGQVGKQVAFVRGGTVVWGPKIASPIDGEVIQLSGDITEEQAKEITRMLKDGT
ncbi:MAG: SecDF P1 head subdomain-containing protein [Mycobacterium sp.]